MIDGLHLDAAELTLVRQTLRRHLPPGCRVRAYGSRATGHRVRPASDLDLLVETPQALELIRLADLRDDFAQSDLPFSVDVLLSEDAQPAFIDRLKRSGTVDVLAT